VQPYLLLLLLLLPNVYTAACPGGVQPAVYEFQFDLEFLLTNPRAFTVNLPRVSQPILLRFRPDLNSLLDSVTASVGGNTPVPGQPSVINSAAVNLKTVRLWTGQVGIAQAGLSAVSFSASLDTWNIYGEIRYLENRTNKWRLFKVREVVDGSTAKYSAQTVWGSCVM
jgi:hypothetical protein